MSEIQNKTILELTSLNEYQYNDAIPVQRHNLHEDNCIALGNIIWFNTNTNQLIINGRYKFDMSSLLQANLSIKLTGDSGITGFTYNNHSYNKNDSIESENSFSANITANVNEHYTFTKWQFKGVDIGTSNPIQYEFTESGELKAVTTLKQYTIAVNIDNVSYGVVNGGGDYSYGENCTITATANKGYEFIKWTKNGSQVSTNPTYTFSVTENANYTAVFREQEAPDYYVGWITGSKASPERFQVLDANTLEQFSTGYFKSDSLVFEEKVTSEMAVDNIQTFFIMWANTVKPVGGAIQGSFTKVLQESDFRDVSIFNVTHNSVIINNKEYNIVGKCSEFGSGDSFLINFEEIQ